MAIGMVSAFGMDVTVGIVGGADGISCASPSLGMYMGAQFDGAGVAGAAQLERRNTQRNRMKEP